MKEQIINFLTNESVLFYKGRGANNGIWESWKGKEETMCDNAQWVHLTKPHSWNDSAHIRVYYYINQYPEYWQGHEIKIEMNILSYCEWETVFEGWIDNVDELKQIFKFVGIPLK